MKKSVIGKPFIVSLIAVLILLAGFIHPLYSTGRKPGNPEKCMQKVPFVLRFSGVHFKGHLCGETGIRQFHDLNIEVIKTPVDPQQSHKLATQHLAAGGFWKWQ